MKEKTELQIQPRLEEDGLFIYLQLESDKIPIDRDSNSYRFIHVMIGKIIKDYEDHSKRIGFIGERELVEYGLTIVLDEFQQFITTGYLRP
jgi:hypothetical protein